MPEIRKLANGIELVLEKLPYLSSASVGVFVRAGSVDEDEHPGISHFIEHMMFKGTEHRKAKEIAEDIDKLGGYINAFTGKEATCYYVRSQSEHVLASAAVLADMLTSSLFDDEEIEKEKGVVIEEMRMIEDDPEDLGHELITEAVFKGSSYESSIIGNEESVSSIKRDDILSYVSDRYAGDQMVISVAGNYDEDALIDALGESFADIPAAGKKRVIETSPFVRSDKTKNKDIEQTHLFYAAPGVATMADEYFDYALYASILGGGMSSRLFQSVREDKGLAYSVYASSSSYTDTGSLLIYGGVNSDKAESASTAIAEELTKLASEGVGEEEIMKVREQYKGQYIFSQESVASRMMASGRSYLLNGKIWSDEEITQGVMSVTGDDIRRLAERHGDLSSYSSVIVQRGE